MKKIVVTATFTELENGDIATKVELGEEVMVMRAVCMSDALYHVEIMTKVMMDKEAEKVGIKNIN